VALYVSVILKFRRSDPPGAPALPEVLTIAAMGFLLAPVNDSANTYLVYCVAVAPFAVMGFRRLLLFVVLLMAVYAIELALLGFKPLLFGITIVVALASGASNYMMLENRRKNVALRRSAEEVQRLARVAERERIGRDLHDLLGHTLSLIAIKSELAAKLINRDRDAAAREITEVMTIARDSLRQVRTAVTGLRSAVLEGEMASARALLESVGVTLRCQRDAMVLPAEIETGLAMTVREAVTNIQRHARARGASIEVLAEEDGFDKGVLLVISDDGCGGISSQGNGLAGIRERVQSLGGTLDIDSPKGEGTCLRVRVPLLGSAASAPLSAGRPRVLHIETVSEETVTADVDADARAVRM
jgi:two-component system sensor histidine kinase DesK